MSALCESVTGWSEATLGELGNYINGRGFKKSEWSRSGRPIIRIQDLTGSGDSPNFYSGKLDQRHEVDPGDLLVSWAATLDAFIWRGDQGCLNQHIFKVESSIEREFHFYLLKSVLSDLRRRTHGGGIVHITRGRFDQARVCIPGLDEQRRVVAKLDELFSDLDAGVAALQRAQANLKRYRASVLKAAVEGRLTAEWRQANPPSETGTELLARLLRERRERWEAEQLAKFEASGKAPPKDWRKKYVEPAAPNTSKLPALPEGWCWATVEQLILRSEYGTSVKCDYEAHFQPVLRIPNIAKGEIDLADIKFSTTDLNQAPSEYLQVGDVLVCRTNGSIKLVGKCAFVRDSLQGAYHFASYLLRFRLLETASLPAWLTSYMSSVPGRAFVESKAASAAGQHNISLSTLHHMPVPLPPAAEMEQALTAVSQVLGACERQESDTTNALQRAKLLRQAILKHAFTGKLVPQDPHDEPASVLLERIRAARAAAPTRSKSRRPAAQKAKPAHTSVTARKSRRRHGSV